MENTKCPSCKRKKLEWITKFNIYECQACRLPLTTREYDLLEENKKQLTLFDFKNNAVIL